MSTTFTVKMHTPKGIIHLKLFSEKTPLTVANFINLAKRGFYDGLNFHRVIKNPPFMIQGGCPEKSGRGGPGYRFKDECRSDLKHDKPGILSMANAGPGTNGSQFFITHTATPWLDGKHTVFGEIVGEEDLRIVNAIEQGDAITKVEVLEDTESFFAPMADQIADWNKVLDAARN